MKKNKSMIMKTKSKYIWLFATLLAVSACSSDDDSLTTNIEAPKPELSNGEADFSKYIAVGASFSGGYTDGALFIAGQENSFPNMLSQKFALVGGGTFSQPLMNDNIGGLVAGTTVLANPRFYFDGSGPAILPATPTTQATNVLTGPFNNYGIPGMKSFHLGVAGIWFIKSLFW